MAITTLQPLAWKMASEAAERALPAVYGMKLPESWRQRLCTLGEVNKLPATKSLTFAVRSAAPEILHFAPNAFAKDERWRPPYWVFASTGGPAPCPERFASIVYSWLTTCYASHSRDLIPHLSASDLTWDHLSLDIPSLLPLSHGLLPELAARMLLSTGFEIGLSNREGQFSSWGLRLLPSDSGQAELVTWPPNRHQTKQWPFFFSYTCKFSVGSLPGREQPVLLCVPGIRRWVSLPLSYTKTNGKMGYGLPWGEISHAYHERKGVHWLSHHAYEQTLLELGLQQYRDQPEWVGRAPEVLAALSMHEPLPDIHALLAQPRDFVQEVVIAYRDKLKQYHLVGTGVESPDRLEVFQQVTAAFAPYGLQPVPELKKTSIHPPHAIGTRYTASDSRDKQVPATVRRQACTTLGDTATIIIEAAEADRVEAILLKELGCENGEALPPNLHIRKNTLPDTLFKALPQTESNHGYAAETRKRAQELADVLPPERGNVGILLELPNYQTKYRYPQNLTDPKKGNRWGCARAGYHTQFFCPRDNSRDDGEKDYVMRVTNSSRDLLRQMGYLWEPLYPGYRKTSLPPAGSLDLLGLWILSENATTTAEKTRKLALVVYAPADRLEVRVCFQGVQEPIWTSYANASLRIPDEAYTTPQTDQQYRNFFTSVLRVLPFPRETLVLLPTVNLQRIFPELADTVVLAQEIRLKHVLGLGEKPVRLVRLRSSTDGKVPVVCPVIPADEQGKYSGLFAHAHLPNVFYSVQGRPVTAGPLKLGKRQLDHVEDHSFNPQSLEIMTIGIDAHALSQDYAFVVHRLRQQAIHTDKATELPEPLHTADKLGEYMQRVDEPDPYKEPIPETATFPPSQGGCVGSEEQAMGEEPASLTLSGGQGRGGRE